MKGIIFREYIDFVSDTFGEDVADDMIDNANLPSGGSYTIIGHYDWKEMTAMVATLSAATKHEPRDLVRGFGQHLLGRLAIRYPQFFSGCNDCFELLQRVDSLIHVEVKKLYPDAELPKLDTQPLENGDLCVVYTSCRPFGDLCLGMIESSARHFGDIIEMQSVPHQKGLTITIRKIDQEAA
jgi:hypothetical protein